MILSEQKPFEEIMEYLEGEENIFILGCNGCAQSSGSGGPVQVEEMKQKLTEAGKNVTGTKVIDFLCEKALVKSGLRGKVKEVEAADSLLVMTCGIGVQAVAASVSKVCHPACNTINLGGSRGEWRGSERCQECGQCLLDYTGGICPLTACTKSLISGACGGATNGKCELSPDRECGWELIYNRLKAKNQLDKLRIFINPLDHSKLMPRSKMMSTSRYALEQSDRGER
ncbi:MAG: methylenetetrahydrofolate reductase C-terminal domain-containing protein [Dehalococcoidia bacterium]